MKYGFKLFGFIFLLSLSSCLKEVKVNDSDNIFPLTLRLASNKESVRLEWDKFSSVGFRKYMIVRSFSPIAAGLTPRNSSAHTIISEITDINTLTFSDHFINTTPIFFYKLYVDVGNRYIESPNLEVKNTLHVFSTTLSGNTAFPYPEKNIALLPHSSFADRTLRLFTLDDYKIIRETEDVSFHFNSLSMMPRIFYTDTDNKNILYTIYSTQLVKFDLEKMMLNNVAAVPNVNLKQPYSIAVDESFIIYTLRDVTDGMHVISRISGQVLKKIAIPNWNEKRIVFSSEPSLHQFTEISKEKAEIFTLSENGTRTISQTFTINENSDLLDEVKKSPDGKYLVFTKSGSLFNHSFEVVTSNSCTDCADFFFSRDSKFIYSVHKHSSTATTLRKYSLPGYELLETFSFTNMSITLTPTTSGIGLFGNFGSGTGISFFKELNI